MVILRLLHLPKDTARDFEAGLVSLEGQNIEGLVIDVRGNPGGRLSSVQDILSQLVTGKKPIVQIEERNGNKTPYFSKLKEKKPYPIVVLIDEGSASASEILAGAMKEIEGYSLVGHQNIWKRNRPTSSPTR